MTKSGLFITDYYGRLCGFLIMDFFPDLTMLNELNLDQQPLQELLLVSTLSDAHPEYIELWWLEERLEEEEYSGTGFCTFL